MRAGLAPLIPARGAHQHGQRRVLAVGAGLRSVAHDLGPPFLRARSARQMDSARYAPAGYCAVGVRLRRPTVAGLGVRENGGGRPPGPAQPRPSCPTEEPRAPAFSPRLRRPHQDREGLSTSTPSATLTPASSAQKASRSTSSNNRSATGRWHQPTRYLRHIRRASDASFSVGGDRDDPRRLVADPVGVCHPETHDVRTGASKGRGHRRAARVGEGIGAGQIPAVGAEPDTGRLVRAR